MRHYQVGLAIAGVTIFFSNIALYSAITGLWNVPPMAIVGVLTLLALPLTLVPNRLWPAVAHPLNIWAIAAFVLATGAYFRSSQSNAARSALAGVFGGAAFLLLMVFLLADPAALRAAKRTVIGCVLLGILLNFYDILHPLSFSPIAGRAAGLYLNPNISAFALVLGLAITIDEVPSPWRSIFVFLVGLGVGLTVSRAGILLWVLGVGILLLQGTLRWTRFAFTFGVVVVGLWTWLVLGGYLDLVLMAASGASDFPLNRLTTISAAGDISTVTRYEVAAAALELIGQHPILGAGLAATTEWALPEPTHNMYLRLWAEVGLMGAVLFPGMVYAAGLGARGNLRRVVSRFTALWLCAGLFSHNLLEERPELVTMAVLGAATLLQRQRRGNAVTHSGALAGPDGAA